MSIEKIRIDWMYLNGRLKFKVETHKWEPTSHLGKKNVILCEICNRMSYFIYRVRIF
jgi:hypothetical protein